VSLQDDLERIAAAAAAHGQVSGVLAAEPTPGRRLYLVAVGEDDARRWLAVGENGEPVGDREVVRQVASLVVMCELASDAAGGGDLEELRQKLAQVRITEQPDGIEQAEAAALELERTLGSPPRLASPAYLDEVGAATRRLEQALGEQGSTFANVVAVGSAAVDGFVEDVLARYLVPLG
jgi:hypothetical protein